MEVTLEDKINKSFDDINNVHIAFIGKVGTGKSTMINAIFCDMITEVKRKATTMNPQIYYVTNDSSKIIQKDVIYQTNQMTNKQFQYFKNEGRSSKKKLLENVFYVEHAPDFLNPIYNSQTYSILDMVGLENYTDKLYYNYVKENVEKIDIFVLFIDISNGSDDFSALEFVSDQIKDMEYKYVHILVNKCENMRFSDDNTFKIINNEDNEIYNNIVKRVEELFSGRIDVTISPISANMAYIHRVIKNGKIHLIEESTLDSIIIADTGKSFLSGLKSIEEKRNFITSDQNVINERYMNAMVESGYYMFVNILQNKIKKCDKILLNHIIQHIEYLTDLISCTDVSYDGELLMKEIDRMYYFVRNHAINIDNSYVGKNFNDSIKSLFEIILSETEKTCRFYLKNITDKNSEQCSEFLDMLSSLECKFLDKRSDMESNNIPFESIDNIINIIGETKKKISHEMLNIKFQDSIEKINQKNPSVEVFYELMNAAKNIMENDIYNIFYVIDELSEFSHLNNIEVLDMLCEIIKYLLVLNSDHIWRSKLSIYIDSYMLYDVFTNKNSTMELKFIWRKLEQYIPHKCMDIKSMEITFKKYEESCVFVNKLNDKINQVFCKKDHSEKEISDNDSSIDSDSEQKVQKKKNKVITKKRVKC